MLGGETQWSHLQDVLKSSAWRQMFGNLTLSGYCNQQHTHRFITTTQQQQKQQQQEKEKKTNLRSTYSSSAVTRRTVSEG